MNTVNYFNNGKMKSLREHLLNSETHQTVITYIIYAWMDILNSLSSLFYSTSEIFVITNVIDTLQIKSKLLKYDHFSINILYTLLLLC